MKIVEDALRARALVERNPNVKISLLAALYLSGDCGSLDLLLRYLDDDNYRNRCATTNTLYEIASDQNKNLIKDALTKRLKQELTTAVQSSIRRSLRNL